MPQPLDPNGRPIAAGSSGTIQLPPAAGLLEGGIGTYARQQGAQQHSDIQHLETEHAADVRQSKSEAAAMDRLNRSLSSTPISPNDLMPNPKDPSGKTSVYMTKSGSVIVPYPAPGKKKESETAKTREDSIRYINTGLDNLERLLPVLSTSHTTLGVWTGDPGRFMAAHGPTLTREWVRNTSALADAIPKALSGRSNQGAINNALNYILPSLYEDNQESARRGIDTLRGYFKKLGATPADAPAPEAPIAGSSPGGAARVHGTYKGVSGSFDSRTGIFTPD